MPLDGTSDDIESDFESLELIGEHVDTMIVGLMTSGAVLKTLRRWFVGHAEPPDEEGARTCVMAMAADLELFTPSMSGRTAVDRHVRTARAEMPDDRRALDALGAAEFRLVRIVDREGPDLVRLSDLVTGESLMLLDSRISPLATGLPTAMRLCPLASGRYVLISPLFAIDESQLATAMTFVRPGRPLGSGYRCAASLYRDAARRGFITVPRLIEEVDEEAVLEFLRAAEERLRPIQRLAIRWCASNEPQADLDAEARRLASVDNLVDACGCFGQMGDHEIEGLKTAYERIAALQMETLAQRARAGVSGAAASLDVAAVQISDYVAGGVMEAAARELFDRLRVRFAGAKPEGSPTDGGPPGTDLDRVIQRIQALRAKTVDRGCTEEEAMAAAAKVSELLGRYDLTLDEISVRKSDCEGVSVTTGRKRRAPVDSCMQPIAEFCDCRVWSEEGRDGVLRYVFFGLKADVAGARFLHDLIEITFETESARFRCGEIYLALRGGDRRMALNSFQVGLAGGISVKLATLKAARQTGGVKSTGFDLVAVKHSVVDEEISKLGLDFVAKASSRRRYVHGDAYAAGKAAGALFEPNAALSD